MKFEIVSREVIYKILENSPKFSNHISNMEKEIDYVLHQMPIPKRSSAYAAGYDFFLPFDVVIPAHDQVMIPTFIKVKLEVHKFLSLYPRSSFCMKKHLQFVNPVGIIDADYYGNPTNEGNIFASYANPMDMDILLKQGDRFCQGIITNYYLVDGDDYGRGQRRVGGIGSTGE